MIILKTNRNFVWSFANSQVPAVLKKIHMLGFKPQEIDMPYSFRLVNQKLFKFTEKLQLYFKEFLDKLKPDLSTVVICAQIRTRNARNDSKIKDEIYQPVSNSKYFWSFINKEFIPKVKKDQNYKIFLTVDDKLLRDEASEIFKEKLIHHEGNDFRNIDYIKNNIQNMCPSSVEQTYKDFYTLQYCDMAIVTKYSQFGSFGVWNKGKLPFLYYSFNRKYEKIKKFSDEIIY